MSLPQTRKDYSEMVEKYACVPAIRARKRQKRTTKMEQDILAKESHSSLFASFIMQSRHFYSVYVKQGGTRSLTASLQINRVVFIRDKIIHF